MTVGADNFASAGVVPVDWSNPGVLGVWTEAFGSNAALTSETGEPAPTGFASSKSAWWKFTPTVTRNLRIDTIGSTGDTEIAVYTGSAVNALTKITSDSDSGGSNTSLIRNLQMVAGTTYYLQVRAFNGVTMNYTVNVRVFPLAPNNMIANAKDVLIPTNGATFSDGWYDNQLCDTEGGEPQPTAGSTAKSAWWKYVPLSSGTIQFDTIGSMAIGTALPDTAIAIYTGGPGVLALTKVASDEDSGGSNQSKITAFAVTAGTTYYLQVSAGLGAQMAYRVNVTGPASVQSVAINRITETDSARAISVGRAIAISRITETDTARAVSVKTGISLNRITETDTARAIGSGEAIPINRITETDSPRPIGIGTGVPINRITETDVARPITVQQSTGSFKWFDGSTTQEAIINGWWDGAAVQPVNVLGWWDGSTIQDLT